MARIQRDVRSRLDELQISQVPVVFGCGRRMFDVLPSRIELDIVRRPRTFATAFVAESMRDA